MIEIDYQQIELRLYSRLTGESIQLISTRRWYQRLWNKVKGLIHQLKLALMP